MPYISTRTNAKITPEVSDKLKAELGRAISAIPGKSEAWLMVENVGGCDLYFKGKNDDVIVFAEVKIFGSTSDSDCDKLTSKLTGIYSELLNAAADHIYIKYEECEHWGWNGSNF